MHCDLPLENVGTSVHRGLLITFVKGNVETAGFWKGLYPMPVYTVKESAVCKVFCLDFLSSSQMMARASPSKEKWLGLNAQKAFGAALCAVIPVVFLQLRSIPVKSAEDDELEEEADWIYRNAFATPTISLQVKDCAWDFCPKRTGDLKVLQISNLGMLL